MAGKTFTTEFQLSASQSGGFSGVFKSGQNSIAALQREIVSLNNSQKDISAYQKQQSAVEATGKKLAELQQHYDNIQREIAETDGFSSKLENQLLSKGARIQDTSEKLETHTQKLDQMGTALSEAGIDANNLTEESARLGTAMEQVAQKQEEAALKSEGFGAAASAAFLAAGQALVAAGIVKGLQEIAGAYKECIDSSVEFESAMTGVAKTTDLSDRELAMMGESIKQLSTEIPITSTELAGIAENAGQLGILNENILDVTRAMADLGVATNLTGEEAIQTFAKFANITGMSQTEFSNLGSSIVYLGNNLATTEADIAAMSLRLAAAGTQAGLSQAEIAGLAGALSSVGLEAEAGGTAFSKTMNMMTAAVETGSDQLEDFASVAGMSAEEFARAYREDAAGALVAFTQGLGDMESHGKSAIVLLDELGLTQERMRDALTRAANSGDLFTNSIKGSNAAWAANTALAAEAEQRYATTESKLIMMENAYGNLKIAVGDVFTPTLRDLYGASTDVLQVMAQFVQQNPALIQGGTAFIGVMGGLVAVLTSYAAIARVAAAIDLGKVFMAATPILALGAGVALLTGKIIHNRAEMKELAKESYELTAASRAQQNEIQSLQAEYDNVSAKLGETSYEAQRLKWEIESLSAEFDSNKQSVGEYLSEHDNLIKSYQDMAASHADTQKALGNEGKGTIALISELERLSATTASATTNKQAILGIIGELNSSLPGLSLSYSDVVNSTGDFSSALMESAQAMADQQVLMSKQKELVDRLVMRNDLESAKKSAKENVQIAQSEFNQKSKIYNDMLKLEKDDYVGWSASSELKTAQAEMGATASQLNAYSDALDENTTAYDENEAAIAELKGALKDYSATMDEAAASGDNMVEAQAKLTAAYNEAYDAALSSIQGQYELWDKADRIVAKSASSMNANMDTQIGYWQNYDANLTSLLERSAEIPGLAAMITSFADGSADSVNMIAGLAQATDAQLMESVTLSQQVIAEESAAADALASLAERAVAEASGMETAVKESTAGMTEYMETLAQGAQASSEAIEQEFSESAAAVEQRAQETTSAMEQDFAESLSQMEADFASGMSAIQSNLESAVAAMDMANRAAAAGRNTIQGFINGANSMLPAVVATYTRIAQAAVSAVDRAMKIQSPSKEMKWRGEMAWTGFIEESKAMTPEVQATMAHTAGMGLDAVSKEDVRMVALAPQLMGAIATMRSNEVVSVDFGGALRGESQAAPRFGEVHVHIHVEGDATPETVVALRESGDEFAERVRAVVENIDEDKRRGSYT